jgi:HD-GYP domain-containing protein (c-di-GMP phosphodiesterase class II)
MEFLYEGMVTPHDIYNADSSILLLSQGNMLRMSQIGAIRRINNDRDIIQVTLETKKLLMENGLGCKMVNQAKLEQETGYDGAAKEAQAMLADISQKHTIPRDTLNTVSVNLFHRLEVTSANKILDLINALGPVGEYLQRHCVNVSLLNGLMGMWLGLPKEKIELLVLVGLAHDCGKAEIPTQILNAPRKLSVAEFDIIKSHPTYGYDLLTDFTPEVRLGTLGHHEKYNGRDGYPNSLSGSSIPIEARITAISDIYDAMVSSRSYKGARTPFNVLAHIKKLQETELDPLITDVFIKNMPNELVNKPVTLSNGDIGAIHAVDPDDLEYPFIRLGRKVVKSDEKLHCTGMYFVGD